MVEWVTGGQDDVECCYGEVGGTRMWPGWGVFDQGLSIHNTVKPRQITQELIFWGGDKITAVFQLTFLNSFSWIKIIFRFQCHWSVPRDPIEHSWPQTWPQWGLEPTLSVKICILASKICLTYAFVMQQPLGIPNPNLGTSIFVASTISIALL